MQPRDERRLESGIVAFRAIVLSEITGLRRLVILSATIIVVLILLNIAAHAYRIYLIESKLNPMQTELDFFHKESNYVCNHARLDSRVQCRLRPASQRHVDDSYGQ